MAAPVVVVCTPTLDQVPPVSDDVAVIRVMARPARTLEGDRPRAAGRSAYGDLAAADVAQCHQFGLDGGCLALYSMLPVVCPK